MHDHTDIESTPYDWATGDGGSAPAVVEVGVDPVVEAPAELSSRALPTGSGNHAPHYRRREKHSRVAVASPTERATASRVFGVALTILLVGSLTVGAAVAWAVFRPVQVTVDGEMLHLQGRATVAEAVKLGGLKLEPGALVSVDGNVIADQGGEPPTVLVNGTPASPWDHVLPGAVITAQRGLDTTETLFARQVEVPFHVTERPTGKPGRIVVKGENGLEVQMVGRFSGKAVSTQVLYEPVAQIIEIGPGKTPSSSEKVVALTFDDGPWNEQTLRVLDILDHYGIKATFFMLGNRVKVNPTIAAEVAKRGHTLGNHSFSHPDLTKESESEVRSQIARTNARIEQVAGKTPRWFRAPGGAVNATVRSVVEGAGMRVAHWTVGTGDWKNLGSQRVVDIVTDRVRPGGVVLLHDGGGKRDQTIEALPKIIENLEAKGYRFVTLDELEHVPGSGSATY